jgi:hypothetical protein
VIAEVILSAQTASKMHPLWFLGRMRCTDSKNGLWFLLTLVCLSRLLLAFIIWKINGPSGFFGPDTETYLEPARSLLQGSFLSHGAYSISGTPEIFRTPGYPLLLLPAIVLRHVVIVAFLENLFFTVASAWLTWHIATDLLPGSQAAFWAVLLYCLEPLGFLHSGKILSETAFTTLFLLFVWVLVRFLREPTYPKLALSALILGCATYIRPAPLYLGLWLIPVFFLFPRTISWRQRASRALLFPVIFALTLAPWVIRNAVVAKYKAFSSAQDWNLYMTSAATVQAKLEHRNPAEVMTKWGFTTNIEDYLRMHPEQRTWPEAEIARFWHTEARRIITSHLLTYFVIHARGCALVIFNPGVSELLRDLGLYPEFGGLLSKELGRGLFPATLWLFRQYPVTFVLLPLMTVQLLFYYLLALVGLRHMPFEVGFLFCALLLYFVLVSGFPSAMSRYRVPVMPLVCVSAGIAIAGWKTRKSATVNATEGTALHKLV